MCGSVCVHVSVFVSMFCTYLRIYVCIYVCVYNLDNDFAKQKRSTKACTDFEQLWITHVSSFNFRRRLALSRSRMRRKKAIRRCRCAAGPADLDHTDIQIKNTHPRR